MKKIIFMSLLSLVFLFASAENSFACSCVMSPEPLNKQVQNAYKNSSAIFSGEVVEIKIDPTDEFVLKVKIKIDKYWKGKTSKEITLTTHKDSSMCGYSFEVGKKYLVYAGGKTNDLSVNNCSRTAILSKNQDIKFLNKLKRTKVR